MARAWTPQEDLPGVRAVMDIRAGRSPASGATASWASQFGSKSATQGTASNQPTYNPDRFGTGRPGLVFDTDFLGGLAVDASSTSRTVVALASFGATSNRTIVGGTADGHYGFRRNNGRQMQVVASNAAAVATDTVVVPDNTPIILASRYTQATIADFRQNGRQTTSVTPTGNAVAASAVMQIGAALGGQQMIGAIGSIVIADAFVSDEDISRIEGWLAHTNGAAALLVDGHPYKNSPPMVATADAPITAQGDARFQSMTGSAGSRLLINARSGSSFAHMQGAATATLRLSANAVATFRAMTGSAQATLPGKAQAQSGFRDMEGRAAGVSQIRAHAIASFAAMRNEGEARSQKEITAQGVLSFAAMTARSEASLSIVAKGMAIFRPMTGVTIQKKERSISFRVRRTEKDIIIPEKTARSITFRVSRKGIL